MEMSDEGDDLYEETNGSATTFLDSLDMMNVTSHGRIFDDDFEVVKPSDADLRAAMVNLLKFISKSKECSTAPQTAFQQTTSLITLITGHLSLIVLTHLAFGDIESRSEAHKLVISMVEPFLSDHVYRGKERQQSDAMDSEEGEDDL